jgi:hypothetical protein
VSSSGRFSTTQTHTLSLSLSLSRARAPDPSKPRSLFFLVLNASHSSVDREDSGTRHSTWRYQSRHLASRHRGRSFDENDTGFFFPFAKTGSIDLQVQFQPVIACLVTFNKLSVLYLAFMPMTSSTCNGLRWATLEGIADEKEGGARCGHDIMAVSNFMTG